MKQKLKELWYFAQWLIKDISSSLSFWNVYFTLLMLSVFVIILVDDYTAKVIFLVDLLILILTLGILAFNFCIVQPLRNKYQEYKQEQRELFDKIKNSK